MNKKLGKTIFCRFCGELQARITLEENRYIVRCCSCNAKYYLKEQKTPVRGKEGLRMPLEFKSAKM